ncbi:chorismate mutase/prephenate dehydratase [Hydrogenivirga caldilitoris]|uniref:Bifunctional chorismate mutase/prephenate dehydratase n=1 Tax=Hydrogenivirga caldilitoris TaxID=246264 RepID=A0A497XTQ2_9AQUI|nr:prephenate dehydratase [Hydrogenivirga caldilitoris]RLJ70303.1 chorismate mutase/prephenate dehydratase [Hydrogenivirga caldilitoris]
MEELKKLREEIDRIDEEILRLLNERARIAREIGEIKKKKNMEIHVPERERAIFEKVLKLNKEKFGEEFPPEALVHIYREIISACLSLEKPLKIAYLGPKATFTHQAALEFFGFSAQYVPCATIRDVFVEVESERADYGVVPVENTIEGVVNYTLDMFLESDLKISGEVVIPINLHLLSNVENLSEVKRVYSHKVALGQCRGWLEKNMPNAQLLETESTAKACEIVLEEEGSAAIASEVASYTYHLNILASNIQENMDNFTRFLIVSKREMKPTGKDKTSLIFAVRDEPGALYRALEAFYLKGVNLTKIESRPSRKRAWDYVFFVDLEGHREDEKVKEVLRELKSRTQMVKILGSYPKALLSE